MDSALPVGTAVPPVTEECGKPVLTFKSVDSFLCSARTSQDRQDRERRNNRQPPSQDPWVPSIIDSSKRIGTTTGASVVSAAGNGPFTAK